MSLTTRGRVVTANQAVLDQADFFQVDGFTRVLGLTVSNTTQQLFFNNVLQPWTYVTGVGVTDAQVVSGHVYFAELATAPGVYGVRFRPNAVGYWRLLITYPSGQQIVAQDYDVTNPSDPKGGLTSSFTKSTC